MKKITFVFTLMLGLFAYQNTFAQASTYPNHQIKIISPFATGGIADGFSRIIAQGLSESFGQPVIVENKAGGGGNIGADFVAKSPADGYTLIMGSIGTHAVNPYLVKNMPYDPLKDFVPVVFVLDAEGLLAVNPNLPVKNVAELIAYLKANPGKVSYGSGGIGTASHLAGELFVMTAKVDMTHIPYKGNALAITDLIGGQTQVMFATMPTILPYVKSDKLRGLAVTGAGRDPSMPDLPSISETLPGFDVKNWIGLFAPAGTPPVVVKKLHDEVAKIMQQPAVQKKLEAEGAKYYAMTPEAFGAFQKKESIRWGKIIKSAGIKPE
ncbi:MULTISPECIES: tripartite tricarboxylate transporter substrate binding protein [unclassified Polynucleobacter]|jgi:tripartite-type tricarboxylate transporter receptor subunit TctC|uniref:Bug family tripartite tricarboxylate transporter substrate binding protein n=1 Tax=unclassified Polynucleobacter TaxID=2640945 RepID=UPI001C0C2B9B|nr:MULTISPECIES: tripartite tricarboxylate transporter substrate binding protein [unclassified Polynucleobacter]MBU3605005.1 tripartite tricarboxylate transporter substrate binding protein [Polynucleobacter sp. AP-Kaivos-20-H2]MBU3618101.1 tripartite tricarboxylate transporter substrate binding protein [Polynucleobacter sp. JS-Fieb-80-E5]